MSRIMFAAGQQSLPARAGALWCSLLAWTLAVGLWSAFAAPAATAEHPELQREIRETREIAAEISKAVRRVQAGSLELRRTLGTEAQNLTAEDITATTLRLARLDADTARLHVTTLDNRIPRRAAALRLLEDDIDRRTAALEGAPADALETLGARAELEQLGELHAVSSDLLEGFRNLQEAEAERLALAEERLTLLRSKAELRTIPETGRFDQDPRAVAIRAIISRLARDAVRLDNEAEAARPKSAPDPARKRLLQLQSGDAIIRSSVRIGDLELIRTENQLDFYEDLIGDASIPVAILREARGELGDQRARLDDRLAAIDADRLTLEGQRELILVRATDSADAEASRLDPVQDLDQLLDFQEADVTRLQQRIADMTAKLDAEIAQRELGALLERRTLPANVGHWQLVQRELVRLPLLTVAYWQGILSDVAARLAALPPRRAAGLGAAILVLWTALWWLHRIGLQRLALLNPAGRSSVPLEGLRRSLPLFVPVATWVVIALTVGVAARPTWLLAGALGMLPLAGVLLSLSTMLFAGARNRGPTHRRLHSLARWALLAFIAAAAVGFVIRSVPVLPSVRDLLDRAGFACLLFAACATWLVRQDLLLSLKGKVGASQISRVFSAATHVVPALMVVAAVSGLAGWINLGWAIAGGVATFVAAAGVALLLCAILQDVARTLERRYGGAVRKGAHGPMETIEAAYRLAVVAVVVGAAWLFASLQLHSATAMAAFWIVTVAAALPFVLQPIQALVASILQIDPERRADGSISIPAICIDRGIRALLIISTVLGLAWALDFDLVGLATGDSWLTLIVRGVFNIAAIVLVADFVWHLAKTAIDSRIQTSEEVDAAETDEARRQARLRTLLPILRNVLLVVIAVTAVLMVLSSIGIQIGPLLAGAGVVGIAVGFGAQTLVRDIFAGVFYLLDDAFRVGEYIQSGDYKGTVEAFSLRSVKIRHHRGSLFTVPFGELGAIQNMSRDWVIDKLTVSVTYDTDLAKTKKVIKEVSKQIMAEPELAENIIEPLKMQGVEQFGDFAIEVRMKMMTKPGEQFVIRRRAYALIKQAFDANGIEFAFPTVTVAGGGEGNAAVAQRALQLVSRKPRRPERSRAADRRRRAGSTNWRRQPGRTERRVPTMEPSSTRELGRTGLLLTRAGMGTAPLGELWERIPESRAEATLAAAWAGGVRYFDTAPWYGNTLAEHRLGHFLRQQRRDSFAVSTKVGRVFRHSRGPDDPPIGPWAGGLPFVRRFDYTYDGVMRAYEDSLQRMGLARVDLLVIHDLDIGYHGDEAGIERGFHHLEQGGGLRALEELKSAGEISGYGAGINEGPMIGRFLERMHLDFFLVAMPYTLLDQAPLDDTFPRCVERGIGIVIGAPYASGILATGPIDGAKHNYSPASPEILEKTRRIEAVCRRHDVPLAAAALQFPLGHPAVAAIIPGAAYPGEVEQNLTHLRTHIPAALWAELKAEGLLHPDAPVPT